MKTKEVESQSNDIDLTPMLDVVFIMLIFFVVTASFLKETSLPLNQNRGSDAVDPSQPVVISVSSSDEITFDERKVSLDALKGLISQKLAENANASVIINAHEQASALSYVSVADAIRQANVTHYTLNTFE